MFYICTYSTKGWILLYFHTCIYDTMIIFISPHTFTYLFFPQPLVLFLVRIYAYVTSSLFSANYNNQASANWTNHVCIRQVPRYSYVSFLFSVYNYFLSTFVGGTLWTSPSSVWFLINNSFFSQRNEEHRKLLLYG